MFFFFKFTVWREYYTNISAWPSKKKKKQTENAPSKHAQLADDKKKKKKVPTHRRWSASPQRTPQTPRRQTCAPPLLACSLKEPKLLWPRIAAPEKESVPSANICTPSRVNRNAVTPAPSATRRPYWSAAHHVTPAWRPIGRRPPSRTARLSSAPWKSHWGGTRRHGGADSDVTRYVVCELVPFVFICFCARRSGVVRSRAKDRTKSGVNDRVTM